MMAQSVVSRSQRRLERKQVVLIVVLVVAIAGVSFALGVMYGRQGSVPQQVASGTDKPELPTVTKIAPPPKPEPEPVEDKLEKLTFYDNLPKGNQAPLGSGINLPPKGSTPVKPTPKEVAKAPAKSPAPAPKQVKAPAADSAGTFVVQVASFRTSEDAQKLAVRLQGYQLSAYVEAADLGDKGVWHRVISGPYTKRESADQAAELLRKKERLSGLVRQR